MHTCSYMLFLMYVLNDFLGNSVHTMYMYMCVIIIHVHVHVHVIKLHCISHKVIQYTSGRTYMCMYMYIYYTCTCTGESVQYMYMYICVLYM